MSRQKRSFGKPATQPDDQAGDLVHLLGEQTDLESFGEALGGVGDDDKPYQSLPVVHIDQVPPQSPSQPGNFKIRIGLIVKMSDDYLFVILGALFQKNLVLSLCVDSQARLSQIEVIPPSSPLSNTTAISNLKVTCFKRFRRDSSKFVDRDRFDGSGSRFSLKAVLISNWSEFSGK